MHIMADRSVCLPGGGIEVELYAVTACGYRCYFLGALTDEAVDSFCAHAGIGAADEVPQALLLSRIGGEDQTRYEKVQLLSKSGDLRVLACAGDLSDVRAFRAGLRQTRIFCSFGTFFCSCHICASAGATMYIFPTVYRFATCCNKYALLFGGGCAIIFPVDHSKKDHRSGICRC